MGRRTRYLSKCSVGLQSRKTEEDGLEELHDVGGKIAHCDVSDNGLDWIAEVAVVEFQQRWLQELGSGRGSALVPPRRPPN